MYKVFAIINIVGTQYKVFPNKILYVKYLGEAYEEGEELIFNSIFLEKKNIKNIQIKGKILAHIKNDKVIILKKKRRKGYQFVQGHRQKISIIKIIF